MRRDRINDLLLDQQFGNLYRDGYLAVTGDELLRYLTREKWSNKVLEQIRELWAEWLDDYSYPSYPFWYRKLDETTFLLLAGHLDEEFEKALTCPEIS